MTEKSAILAARNNAEWCDAVCRAHGVPGEFFDDLWLNRQPTPPFYPNAVTLTPDTAEIQTERIREFLQNGFEGGFAVKDSFCTLDVAQLGFEVWFSAEWIYRPASIPSPNVHLGGVAWRKIESEADLIAWEAAWNAENDPPVHVFNPLLLTDKNIAFFAAYNNRRIVAGGIANKTGDVVGISNIFTPDEAAPDFWANFVRVVIEAFPGLALVGYERDDALEIAHGIGFQSVGTLRVCGRNSE